MEKHNEIVAAVAGYVIGGATVFIALGFGQQSLGLFSSGTDARTLDPAYQTSSVQTLSRTRKAADATITEVIDNDEGLFVVVQNDKRIVSVKTDDDVISEPANHIAIKYHELSPNGSELFYCAVTARDSDKCAGMIYRAADHSITVMKDDAGQPVLYDLNTVNFTWVDGEVVVSEG